MSYPKQVIKIRPTGGIANDLPAFEVAPEFYTSGDNVHFRSTFAERTTGHASIYETMQTEVRSLLNLQSGGLNYWLYNGIDSSYAVTVATHSDITLAAGLSSVTGANQWTTGLLNGVPFACNGIDPPMTWDFNPANPMTALANFPASASCYSMRPFKYFLIALNMSEAGGTYPEKLIWSNSAEPGALPSAWTAAATNDAGSAILAETPGKIIDGATLRASFVIGKEHSCYVMDYVGGINVFNFRKLFETTGFLTRNCAVDVNGQLLIVADGDVILTDGNTTQSVIDNKMRRFLFNQLDQDNYQATHVIRYQKENEVWVCFPSSGNSFCDLALIWDSQAGTWGVRDLPGASCSAIGLINDAAESSFIDDQPQVIDTDHSLIDQQSYNLTGDNMVQGIPDDGTPTDSLMLEIDSGTDFNGTAIAASLRRDSMDFGEPNRFKFIKRVIPHVKAVDGTVITVRVGTQVDSQGSTAWTSSQNFTVGTTRHIDVTTQGKYISFEFTTSAGSKWVLPGWDVEYELRGYY